MPPIYTSLTYNLNHIFPRFLHPKELNYPKKYILCFQTLVTVTKLAFATHNTLHIIMTDQRNCSQNFDYYKQIFFVKETKILTTLQKTYLLGCDAI
jgi:hypothetical protein